MFYYNYFFPTLPFLTVNWRKSREKRRANQSEKVKVSKASSSHDLLSGTCTFLVGCYTIPTFYVWRLPYFLPPGTPKYLPSFSLIAQQSINIIPFFINTQSSLYIASYYIMQTVMIKKGQKG